MKRDRLLCCTLNVISSSLESGNVLKYLTGNWRLWLKTYGIKIGIKCTQQKDHMVRQRWRARPIRSQEHSQKRFRIRDISSKPLAPTCPFRTEWQKNQTKIQSRLFEVYYMEQDQEQVNIGPTHSGMQSIPIILELNVDVSAFSSTALI